MKIGYYYGAYDILRAADLRNLDRQIQIQKANGSKLFAVGIYEDGLCQALGFNKPIKSIEDRMQIMSQMRGVDFVFPISSLDETIIKERLKLALREHNRNRVPTTVEEKKYDVGYAPGTYDLFHTGHLENLTIAASQCKELIVGIKSDELVQEHKHKQPHIPADERLEIVEHFRFVKEAYIYHTRNLNVANDWIHSKYGKNIDAVFLGEDLRKDFENTEGINIVFTPRPPELMKQRSTTALSKKIKASPNKGSTKRYTGCILTDKRLNPICCEVEDDEVGLRDD